MPVVGNIVPTVRDPRSLDSLFRHPTPVTGRGPQHRANLLPARPGAGDPLPRPFVRLSAKWLVRQLAPDSSPVEIETMSGQKDQGKLLHAMAWETANVHLGAARAGARISADLQSRSRKWLRTAVKDVAAATIVDLKAWKKSQS